MYIMEIYVGKKKSIDMYFGSHVYKWKYTWNIEV